MKLKQFKNHLEHLTGAILFDYRGHSCGVDPISKNHYDVWCGDDVEIAKSIDDVLKIDIFEGKPLIDIFDECVDFDY